MTIAIEILTLAVLLLLLYAQWKGKPVGKLLGIRRRRKKKGADPQRAEEMERVASQALQELHCEVTWDTENTVRIGQFDFQNGHFQLRIDPSSAYASLAYLFCFNVQMDQINLVRKVVNKCNINSENHRVIYTINGRTCFDLMRDLERPARYVQGVFVSGDIHADIVLRLG